MLKIVENLWAVARGAHSALSDTLAGGEGVAALGLAPMKKPGAPLCCRGIWPSKRVCVVSCCSVERPPVRKFEQPVVSWQIGVQDLGVVDARTGRQDQEQQDDEVLLQPVISGVVKSCR